MKKILFISIVIGATIMGGCGDSGPFAYIEPVEVTMPQVVRIRNCDYVKSTMVLTNGTVGGYNYIHAGDCQNKQHLTPALTGKELEVKL